MNRTRVIAPVVGLLVFFGVWELFVRAFDIRPFVLARPSRIVRYLARFPDDYFKASMLTMKHAALGFAFAIVVALLIGAAMAASRFLEQATQPVLTLIAVTPFAAYIGSVKIGLGSFSEKPVIFIVALVSLPAFTFAAADGMRSADPSSREAARLRRRLGVGGAVASAPAVGPAVAVHRGEVQHRARPGRRLPRREGYRWPRRDRRQGIRQQRGRAVVGDDLVDGRFWGRSAWCCSTCCNEP